LASQFEYMESAKAGRQTDRQTERQTPDRYFTAFHPGRGQRNKQMQRRISLRIVTGFAGVGRFRVWSAGQIDGGRRRRTDDGCSGRRRRRRGGGGGSGVELDVAGDDALTATSGDHQRGHDDQQQAVGDHLDGGSDACTDDARRPTDHSVLNNNDGISLLIITTTINADTRGDELTRRQPRPAPTSSQLIGFLRLSSRPATDSTIPAPPAQTGRPACLTATSGKRVCLSQAPQLSFSSPAIIAE